MRFCTEDPQRVQQRQKYSTLSICDRDNDKIGTSLALVLDPYDDMIRQTSTNYSETQHIHDCSHLGITLRLLNQGITPRHQENG